MAETVLPIGQILLNNNPGGFNFLSERATGWSRSGPINLGISPVRRNRSAPITNVARESFSEMVDRLDKAMDELNAKFPWVYSISNPAVPNQHEGMMIEGLGPESSVGLNVSLESGAVNPRVLEIFVEVLHGAINNITSRIDETARVIFQSGPEE